MAQTDLVCQTRFDKQQIVLRKFSEDKKVFGLQTVRASFKTHRRPHIKGKLSVGLDWQIEDHNYMNDFMAKVHLEFFNILIYLC